MKKNKKTNVILLFIKMLIIFGLYDFISSNIYPWLSKAILYGRYGREFIIEMTCVLLAVIVLLIFKNTYIFHEKRENFKNSLKVSGYMLTFSVINLIAGIFSLEAVPASADLISLLLFCLSIGIMEEILCRGWIQNEFIERYGTTRKKVIISILLSSLIFGGMHISNIWIGGQSVIDTVCQIIHAVGAGFLLGTVYFRTKNIWANSFVHGFWDFSLFLSSIYTIKDCVNNSTDINYIVTSIVSSLIVATVYFIIGLYILRKNKINNLVEEKYTEEELIKSEKNKELLISIAFVLFGSLSCLPQIEQQKTCYTYEKKSIPYNEVTYSNYNDIIISYENNSYELKLSNNTFSIINISTEEETIYDQPNITNFAIINNKDKYLIVLTGLNKYKTDTVTYYSYFNIKEASKEDFANNIINSIKLIESAPTTEKIGYITSLEDNNKYIFIETYKKEKMILVEDELFILTTKK